jgi:hypothetical protein
MYSGAGLSKENLLVQAIGVGDGCGDRGVRCTTFAGGLLWVLCWARVLEREKALRSSAFSVIEK